MCKCESLNRKLHQQSWQFLVSLMKNTLQTPLTNLNYLNWTLQPQPQRATSLPLPLQCQLFLSPMSTSTSLCPLFAGADRKRLLHSRVSSHRWWQSSRLYLFHQCSQEGGATANLGQPQTNHRALWTGGWKWRGVGWGGDVVWCGVVWRKIWREKEFLMDFTELQRMYVLVIKII